MTTDVIEEKVETETKEPENTDKVDDVEALKQSIMDTIKGEFEAELSKIKSEFQQEITKKNDELNDLRAINSALAMNTSGNNQKNDSVFSEDFADIDFDKVSKGILDGIDAKIIKH